MIWQLAPIRKEPISFPLELVKDYLTPLCSSASLFCDYFATTLLRNDSVQIIPWDVGTMWQARGLAVHEIADSFRTTRSYPGSQMMESGRISSKPSKMNESAIKSCSCSP